MINSKRQIIALIIMMAFLSACGGEPDSTNVESQNNIPETNESPEQNPQLAVDDLHYGENEVPLKPMQLSETRYMKEMVREEIARAYGESGEFIDPRRIIDILQNESDEVTDNPEPQRLQDSVNPPRSWRISYEVHNEAKALFEQGEYARAAQKWRNLATDRRAFTLSVEVDCDPSVLKSGYAVLQSLEMPIFVLPERVAQRECFRLCAGVFLNESSAKDMIEEIKMRIPDSWPFAVAFASSDN